MELIRIHNNLKSLLILILLISIYIGQSVSSWTLLPQKEAERIVPKIIIQTTHLEVPPKVANQFDKYARGYKRIVYNERQAREFLRDHYNSSVLEKYDAFPNGAHKADLFRYAVLYLKGGIYLDIKTELIMPMDYILSLGKKENTIYSVISRHFRNMYQGIIIAPRFQPFFLQLLEHMITVEDPSKKYLFYTRYMEKLIRIHCNQSDQSFLKEGDNVGEDTKLNFFLFKEIEHNPIMCHDGKDRYGGCFFIELDKEKLFKQRFADYPWKRQMMIQNETNKIVMKKETNKIVLKRKIT